jgi:hypothetical protein
MFDDLINPNRITLFDDTILKANDKGEIKLK